MSDKLFTAWKYIESDYYRYAHRGRLSENYSVANILNI